MKLNEMKDHRFIYYLISKLIAFDTRSAETLFSGALAEQLSLRVLLSNLGIQFDEKGVVIASLAELDISPIVIPTSDNKGVIHEVCTFCRTVSEYIGDYIDTEILTSDKELMSAMDNILLIASKQPKRGGNKINAKTEREFLAEWVEVISGIMEDMDDDSEVRELSILDEDGESSELDADGNELPGEDGEEEPEDEDVDEEDEESDRN